MADIEEIARLLRPEIQRLVKERADEAKDLSRRNLQVDRLFGEGKPGEELRYTWRNFYADDEANNQMGFEKYLATPYTLSSPFSWASTPADSYAAEGQSNPHWLQMVNSHGSTPLTLQWTSSTGKNYVNTLMGMNFNITGSDVLVAEIRGWGVQSPGGSDYYYGLRFAVLGSTYPAYPWMMGLFYGQGTTFALANGTRYGGWMPFTPGLVYKMQLQASSGPWVFLRAFVAEGSLAIAHALNMGSYPTSFKTVQWYLAPGTSMYWNVDEIYLS